MTKRYIQKLIFDMKKNAFTLIELLVVVAIIGILAAVGVVAYNGYTKSAKINATKANHETIVKFISSSMILCETGAELILNSPSGKTSNQCSKLYQGNLANYRAAMVTHFQYDGSTWCSPYGQKRGKFCEPAILDGGAYSNSGSKPTMTGTTKISYAFNASGSSCWSLVVISEVADKEYLETEICK